MNGLQINSPGVESDNSVGWLRTIVYGSGISMVGQVSNLLMAAILQFIIARNLGAAKSGSIAFGLSLMSLFANLSLIGLDKGIVRFFPAYKTEPGKQSNLVLASGLISLSISILFVMAFWLRPWLITDLFPKQEQLYETLPYFLLLIPGSAMIAYLAAVTQALKKFAYQAFFIQILLPVLKISMLLWLIDRMVGDVKTIVLGFVVITVLVVCLLGIALLRSSRPIQRVVSIQAALRSLLIFSMPLFFITIVDYGWSEAQILILGSLVSSDKIGIFNVALRLTLILTIFQTGFGTVFAPIIAELHQDSNMSELSRWLKVITRWSTSITMPVFLVMFCFAGDLLSIFGNEFVAGKLVLQLLAVGIFFNVAVGPIGWFIVLTGRSYLSLMNSCIALLINISVTFFLTARFGIIGAAIAILLGLVVINLLRLIQIRSIFGIHPFSTSMWKSLLAGCVVFLLGTALARMAWPLFFSLTIWGVLAKLVSSAALLTSAYACMLYLFRFDEYDQHVMGRIRLRINSFFKEQQSI